MSTFAERRSQRLSQDAERTVTEQSPWIPGHCAALRTLTGVILNVCERFGKREMRMECKSSETSAF